MPTSDPRAILGACNEIIQTKPGSVLDIGIGFGKWGVLAREYTDIWDRRFYHGEWKTYILGIEIHEKYRNPVWGVYDEVRIGDALKELGICAAAKARFDLAIMIDVLEHFEKDQGQLLLDKVMQVSGKFLVSYSNSHQKDVRDNRYEDHLSTWQDVDFERFNRRRIVGDETWGLYMLESNGS